MQLRRHLLIFTTLVFTSTLAWGDSAINHDIYLKAEQQLNKRHYNQFHITMDKINNHPLKPYLQARWLQRQFYRKPITEIDTFLKKHKDQPVAKKLNRQWVMFLAKKNEWHLFLDYYKPTGNLALQCQRVTALESTNNHFKAITEGRELWLKGIPLPRQCDKLYKNWKRIGYLTDDLIWQRLITAQENRKYKLVRYLKKQLPSDSARQFKSIQSAWSSPERTFTNNALANLEVNVRVSLLKRALKKRPDYWVENQSNDIFKGLSVVQKSELELIAITAGAKQKDNNQYNWYQLASQKKLLNSELEKTFLQGAVQSQNWTLYSHYYKLSHTEIKAEGKWQYWQARALELLGAPHEMSKPYYQLSSANRDYYGFLASQQLGISASMNHSPTHVSASIIQRTRLHPSVKRALAFLDLGRIPQARREWQHAYNSIDDSGRQALALLAGRLEWSDRAIMTLAQLKDWHDLQLRFPLAHEPLIDKAAKRSNIEKTWIYGITRQESAFMYDARSPVGATGLMQLMPATAKSVSRRLKLKYSAGKLIDPKYNVSLGSHYLKTLLKRYKGNRVLATAAYNAGPTNVKRWLKRFDAPLDIWIENIPFNETKEYVQRVLAYSTIYSYRLGGLQPMLDADTLTSWQHQSETLLNISRLSKMQNTQG